MAIKAQEMVWIFGYGSLIWNPGFDFEGQKVGYIRGWSRRFYQGSPDHRGIPGAPGRVVTLLADSKALCWGKAFQTADPAIFEYLDHRERGGFDRFVETFYTTDSDVERHFGQVYVYVAKHDNPHYLGPAELPEIAAQIFRSQGPSGTNIEYLMRLAQALRTLNVIDEHVFALEQQVHALLSCDSIPT